MQVIRFYMHNALRNFNYLIACEKSREAIALDPFDAQVMLAKANEYQLTIKLIINTHEHWDHVQGNLDLQRACGAPVLAHANAKVPGQSGSLAAGDRVQLGSLELQALFTPGHTGAHLCLQAMGQECALFSGDVLFNASAGNCRNGGNVDVMYDTFVRELAALPDHTLLYPGHDYMKNNLTFALDRDPENHMAAYWQDQIQALGADDMPIMTLGQERQYNPFLRLQDARIHAKLAQDFPNLSDERSVFKALRQLRDLW